MPRHRTNPSGRRLAVPQELAPSGGLASVPRERAKLARAPPRLPPVVDDGAARPVPTPSAAAKPQGTPAPAPASISRILVWCSETLVCIFAVAVSLLLLQLCLLRQLTKVCMPTRSICRKKSFSGSLPHPVRYMYFSTMNYCLQITHFGMHLAKISRMLSSFDDPLPPPPGTAI